MNKITALFDKLEQTKPYQLIYEFGDRMSKHKTFILAGGIAFNILLYIIPLVLILVLFVNMFVEPDVLIDAIESGINVYLPGVENYAQIIAGVVSEVNNIASSSKIFGIVGFVILLWLSSSVVSTINSCITHIFELEQPNYIRTKLKDIGMTMLLNILIVLYGVLLPVLSFASSFINSVAPDEISIWLSKTIVILTNVIVSALFFYFIYWIIPSSTKKKKHRIALYATLIAVFATEIARFLFTLYISTISNYSKFYGTYAVIVTMLVWIFYSCFIILFSAELSKYLYDLRTKKELETTKDTRSIIEKYRYKQKLKKHKKKKNG